MKIKIIQGDTYKQLEEGLNNWLKDEPSKRTNNVSTEQTVLDISYLSTERSILNISYLSTMEGYIAIIEYRDTMIPLSIAVEGK